MRLRGAVRVKGCRRAVFADIVLLWVRNKRQGQGMRVFVKS